MLDIRFIQRKVKLIRQDLEVLTDLADLSFNAVAKDLYRYSTVQLLLMKIIGRAIDINEHLIGELATAKIGAPVTYRETFLKLKDLDVLPAKFAEQIAESAGFRNAVVHEYNNLDKWTVYRSVNDALKEYTQYCGYILKFLSKHSSKK